MSKNATPQTLSPAPGRDHRPPLDQQCQSPVCVPCEPTPKCSCRDATHFFKHVASSERWSQG